MPGEVNVLLQNKRRYVSAKPAARAFPEDDAQGIRLNSVRGGQVYWDMDEPS